MRNSFLVLCCILVVAVCGGGNAFAASGCIVTTNGSGDCVCAAFDDSDGDGYGAGTPIPMGSVSAADMSSLCVGGCDAACCITASTGACGSTSYADIGGDCNDTATGIYPGAGLSCTSGIDSNCKGFNDERSVLCPALSAPTSVTAALQSDGSVKVTWQDNSDDETLFVINVEYDSSGSDLPAGGELPNATTFTHSAPTCGKSSAVYKVYARKGGVFSDVGAATGIATASCSISVTLAVDTNTASETAGSRVVTVSANAASPVSGNQTVTVAVTGGTVNASDYTLSGTTITIPGGASNGSVTFTVVDDVFIEGTETAILTISSPSAGIALGSTVTQTITITDNDTNNVNLTVSSNTASEATPAVPITVTATADTAVTGDQTVNLAVTGTVSSGDYTLSGTTITILSGNTTGTATFTVVDDALIEGAETAILTISSPSAGIALGSTVTQNIAITDNDTNNVNLSVSSNTASEAAPSAITVTATADSAVTSAQTVTVAVSGTGITTGDYTLSSTTITIPSSGTTGSVTFTVLDDALVEGTETATLTISSPSAGIALGSTVSQNITITDNDSLPTVNLSVSSNTASEASPSAITVTATASSAVTSAQTVTLTGTGTAADGTDYNLSSHTITIPSSSTSGSVTFTVVDDALVEGTETATLTISSPSSGIALGSTVSQNIVITDNDTAAAVTAGVTLNSIGNITGSTVLANGNATGAGIGERGFYWWIPPSTATHFGGSESGLIPEGYGAGSFSLKLTGLKPGNAYHVKAYIKVGGQIVTSDEQLFTTATTGATGNMAPTVLTDTANYTVSGNSITVNGEITDVGSTPVNVYGFIYAPHTAPYTGDEMPKNGDTAYAMWDQTPVYQGMTFTATIKNIPPGKWYLRAYAHNTNPDSDAAQTASLGYGADITFTIACTPETCIPGDVNGDGKVDLADAMLVLRILAGIPVGNVNLNADVNGDGKIGLEELGYILQKVAEVR